MSKEIIVGKLRDDNFSITIKIILPSGKFIFLEDDSLLETKEKFFIFSTRKIHIPKYPDYYISIKHSYFWGNGVFELIKNEKVVCRCIDSRNVRYSFFNTFFYLINILISFLISFALLKITKAKVYPYLIFFGTFTICFFSLIKIFDRLSKKIYDKKFQ